MTTKQVEALRTPEVKALLGRAAFYEMLSLAFSYPDADWREDLLANIEDLRDDDITPALGLEDGLDALSASLAAADDSTIAAEHNRLFAGEVPCSAHETEYSPDPFVKGRQLADIAGFYRAFGLQTGNAKGLPDFVSTELEFMSFLVRKEAFAAVKGWSARAEICEKAERSFVESHLGRWLPAFARDAEATATEFYAGAARLAAAFVATDAALMGTRPAPVSSRHGRPEDAETFVCGLEAGTEDGDQDGLIEMMPIEQTKDGPDTNNDGHESVRAT